jgi:hypothetical protein
MSFSGLLDKAIKERGEVYTELPTSNLIPLHQDSVSNSSQSSSLSTQTYAKRVGRSVVGLAFLAQCAGTIFLHTRRRQYSPDAITMIDQRVFELACGGVLMAIVTLGTVAKISIFIKIVPEQGNTTNTHKIVVSCRNAINDKCRERDYPAQLCRNGAFSFIIMCAMGRFRLWYVLRGLIYDI